VGERNAVIVKARFNDDIDDGHYTTFQRRVNRLDSQVKDLTGFRNLSGLLFLRGCAVRRRRGLCARPRASYND